MSMTEPVIAVVDDDPLILKYMDMLLRHHGYETLLWNEARSACDMIRRRQPDVVLLDLSMQGDARAGLKVLDCLHAEPATAAIPVIIVSGTVDTLQGADRLLSRLAYARLLKPIDSDVLLAHVANALQAEPRAAHQSRFV
jgi:CheY-like chemotaxis protein